MGRTPRWSSSSSRVGAWLLALRRAGPGARRLAGAAPWRRSVGRPRSPSTPRRRLAGPPRRPVSQPSQIGDLQVGAQQLAALLQSAEGDHEPLKRQDQLVLTGQPGQQSGLGLLSRVRQAAQRAQDPLVHRTFLLDRLGPRGLVGQPPGERAIKVHRRCTRPTSSSATPWTSPAAPAHRSQRRSRRPLAPPPRAASSLACGAPRSSPQVRSSDRARPVDTPVDGD